MRNQITRTAEDLQSPWTKWVARNQADITATRPQSCGASAACSSQEPTLCSQSWPGHQLEQDWLWWLSTHLILHHPSPCHSCAPSQDRPQHSKMSAACLPKCTETQKTSPWPRQTDFWKVLSMCMDASGVIKPNSNYSQWKHLSSVQHPWDSTPKANSISEWLQLFTLQILLE